jgi:hypothetical protein
VLFLAEEIEERLADLSAGEHGAVGRRVVEKGAKATWHATKVKPAIF